MIRAGKHPHNMRRYQTDKSDGSADGHANADQHGNGDQHGDTDSPDVDADAAGVVFPDGKCIQLPGVQQQDRAADRQGAQQYQRVLVAAAGQGTHGPEGNVPHLVPGKIDHQRHDAGNKHGENDAHQDDRVGGQGIVQFIGQPQDQKK